SDADHTERGGPLRGPDDLRRERDDAGVVRSGAGEPRLRVDDGRDAVADVTDRSARGERVLAELARDPDAQGAGTSRGRGEGQLGSGRRRGTAAGLAVEEQEELGVLVDREEPPR